jgi:hypothetical protein
MDHVTIGTRVQVTTGRNAGEVGNVINTERTPNGVLLVYIDFDRMINVNEGYGSVNMYPDGYWVSVNDIKEVI